MICKTQHEDNKDGPHRKLHSSGELDGPALVHAVPRAQSCLIFADIVIKQGLPNATNIWTIANLDLQCILDEHDSYATEAQNEAFELQVVLWTVVRNDSSHDRAKPNPGGECIHNAPEIVQILNVAWTQHEVQPPQQ